jgi:hypothetical protein
MYRYIWLLVLIFIWGCDENPSTPENPFTDNAFGSSVIKIPGLPRDSISAEKVMYRFSLTITGTNMEPIGITRSIYETGAIIKVDRIPAGRSRMFKGSLYGSNGVSYEGKAYADIFGGKVTNVRLMLRRTGAAQVEVIIEDMQDTNKFEGCYHIKGSISNIDISDLTIEIPETPDTRFGGYFKKEDKKIGKFKGTVINGEIEATIYIETLLDKDSSMKEPVEAIYRGLFSKGFNNFKGKIISRDGQSIGFMTGNRIICKPPAPEKCIGKTLGGIGSTSCKDTTTWKKYAADLCLQLGRVLGSYKFISKCNRGDTDNVLRFEAIEFEACLPEKIITQ